MSDNKQMDNFLDRVGDANAQAQADEEVAEERAVEQEAAPEAPEAPSADEAPADVSGAEADAGGADADEGGPAEGDRPARHVPIQALDEERHRRSEMQTKLDAQDQTIQRMNQLFVDFANRQSGQPMEYLDPQAAQQEQVPHVDDDPVGHLSSRIAQLEQTAQGYQQQSQQAGLQQQADQAIASAATNFSQAEPTYPQAVQHLFNVEVGQHIAMGKNQAAAQQAAIDAFRYSSVEVLASGGDPARALFERAKAVGWQAAPNPEGGSENLQQKVNQLQAVDKGQQTNRSLSEGGAGRASGNPTSLEELAALDNDADIMKHWDSVVGKQGNTFGGILK